MDELFNNKLKVLLPLLMLGLLILVLGRTNRPADAPNLLTNPDFESDGLTGWQIGKVGDAQAMPKPSADTPGNILLTLEIPDTAVGSWVGVGQRLVVTPLQRYRLEANYRLAYEGQRAAKMVLRVSQFDQAGQLIKEEELSEPNLLLAGRVDEAGQRVWNLLAHNFVTDERTTTVEIGLGLFGQQSTAVEIDDLVFKIDPTHLSTIRYDAVAFSASLLLLGMLGYVAGRVLWPIRWKVVVNVSLAVASLALTLIVAEIVIRFLPITLTSPNWPSGYHVLFMEGKSYRLAKNYPPVFITDSKGHRHLIMSNSLGIRDREVVPLDREQTIVLVLGDSMTFGLGLSDVNDTWPRRVEAEIARISPELDGYYFVNAGVSGYNTFQAVFLFQTLIKDMEQQGVKPKIALLSFFSGHWERNLYGPEGAFTIMHDVLIGTKVRQELLNLPGHLVDQSRFDNLKLIGARRINYPHQMLLSQSKLYFILSMLVFDRLGSDQERDLLQLPGADPVAASYRALKSFKEVAEINDIYPVVVYLPDYKLFQPARYDENRAVLEQLSAICQRLEMTFINPYENMQKLGVNGNNATEKLTLARDSHYSAEGYSLYARALAPLLVDYFTQLQKASLSSPAQAEIGESK